MNRPNARIGPFFLPLFLLSLAFTSLTWADEDDPPARVARMNYAQGQVSFQPGGEGDWVEAVPNRPLTTNDNLWTDRDSRAELHIGSTAIRVASETSLTFLELDDSTVQLRLAQGSTLIRVRHLDDEDNMEIDTPNIAFRIQRQGEFRVDVNPDGRSTTIEAFQGRGEVVGGGNNFTVVAGQQAVFTGDENLDYDIVDVGVCFFARGSPGEVEEVFDKVAASSRLSRNLLNVRQTCGKPRLFGQVFTEHLRITDDRAQWRIQLVGDTGGKLADADHLFLLDHRLLRLFQLTGSLFDLLFQRLIRLLKLRSHGVELIRQNLNFVTCVDVKTIVEISLRDRIGSLAKLVDLIGNAF